VANVTTSAAGKLFTYFDASGTDLGAAPALAAIKRIRVAFAVRAKNPDGRMKNQIVSELSTSVEVRN
jgi:hypothetical protein